MMCCGIPEDIYDLVIVAESEREIANAFAEAFIGRDLRRRVAVVLPPTGNAHPDLRRLQRSLDLSEITVLQGHACRDSDPHYLNIDGRLVYGDSILMHSGRVTIYHHAPIHASSAGKRII